MDYSKLSDKDLIALSNNDYAAISDEGLKYLSGGTNKPKTEKKGIDLTPSGLVDIAVNTINAGLETPVRMIKDKQSLSDAFKSGYENSENIREQVKNLNPVLSKVTDFSTDMAGYNALPVLRGGGVANFIGNAAIQGGVPGIIEGLKREENPLTSGGTGTGIAAVLQGITPKAGKLINKALESDFVQKNLPKVLEGLTSVPADYSQRALEKELAGNSILNGKFDADSAYIPIERKLRQAKELLPNAEDYAEEYYKLGKNAADSFENLKAGAGQEISDMLSKLSDKPVDIGGLKNAINSTIKNFAKGGEVNPAEIRAGRELEQVRDLLGIKGEEETNKALLNYVDNNKIGAVGNESALSKEAEDIAFDILAQATGKNKNWLKSQLNANLPKMATQKRQEFIRELLENTQDKINNIDGLRWNQYFPEFNWENLQEGGADTSVLAKKMLDKILRKDFKTPLNLLSPDEQAIGEASNQYNKILNKIAANPNQETINKGVDSFGDLLNYLPKEIVNDFANKFTKDVDNIKNIVSPKVKPIDLHNIKELLYDVANYDTAGGIKNDAIKGVANQINNFLRNIEPNYKRPNDIFSLIKSIEKDAGGLNPNTLGKKLSEIGSKNNLVSGLDQRLKNIDNILPYGNKFYKKAQQLNSEKESFDNIRKLVSQQYERNPRLLANRTDEAFENAINDLQNKTNVKFMDELNDIRAREALEKFFPGQGGGSGSSQGFGNLLRTALIGGSPVAAVTMHNPAALAGLALVSPKIMAKGTIKNIGKLSNTAKKAAEGAYNEILNRLSNLGAKGAANMLYGGSYED